MATLFTMGYEGLDIGEFTDLLIRNGVEILVDIREAPISRKQGFSKRVLAERLEALGIGYVHMKALGCPRPIRDRFRRDRDLPHYRTDYREYLATQTDALDELAARCRSENCVLLCFEADHKICHRSMVAEAVAKICDVSVYHIEASGRKSSS